MPHAGVAESASGFVSMNAELLQARQACFFRTDAVTMSAASENGGRYRHYDLIFMRATSLISHRTLAEK
jgi:hypothetical protein